VLLKQGLDIVLTHAAEVLPQSHEFEYQIRGAVELDDDRDNKAGCLVGLFLDFDRNMPGSTHPNSPKIKIRAAGVPRTVQTHTKRDVDAASPVFTQVVVTFQGDYPNWQEITLTLIGYLSRRFSMSEESN